MSAISRRNEAGSSRASRLNAHAQPYFPLHLQHGSRIQRSLYITFSNGLPLTPRDIHEYFAQVYGEPLEFVYVHRKHGRAPEFGRIMFQSADMAARFLGDRTIAKIFIRGKPMWLKKYLPRLRN